MPFSSCSCHLGSLQTRDNWGKGFCMYFMFFMFSFISLSLPALFNILNDSVYILLYKHRVTHAKNVAQVHRGGYNFVSWNVKGLGHVIKQAKVFSHLKSLCADIIFLQETHIKHTSKGKLKVGWVDQLYEANFSTKARGVAILIRKNIPFIKSSVINDPNGRFVIVAGTLNSVPTTLVNLYAPNFDNPDFFPKGF